MRLEIVHISHLRSVEHGELANCGAFNVLIGKNNSGKSNILAAIDAFFGSIENGNLVTLSPPFREEIDFFEKNTIKPISITLSFSLSLSERDELIRDIVLESPAMKNAVDGIDPALTLIITLNITPPPKNFGYISKVILKPNNRSSEFMILGIEPDAAQEIYLQLSQSSDRLSVAEALSNTDQSSVRAFWESRREARSRLPISYLLRQVSPSEITTEMRRTVESVLDFSNSAEEFYRELRSLAAKMQAEATAIISEPLKNKLSTFAGEESSIPNYAVKLITNIAKMKILYLKERRKIIGREEASRLLELKVERGGPEVLRNIQETVAALLGVQIDAFRSKAPVASNRGELAAEMDVDNFLVQVNGSGVREALRLILDFEFEKPSILLVEEPEVHLHPALEMGMMRYLKRISSGCQVFLTTHSTNFLDTADMKNVYLISKQRSTQIRLLDIEDAENEIPRELGIRLSSLFMFDRLVFVEGPSDEAVLREWASIMGVNLSQANVGFVHMDGVRNFTHYAAEKTLSFLSKRQVRMWFILDHDERDDKEISTLRKRLEGKAFLKVLSRREIENYLVQPRLILELIKMKRELGGIVDNNLPSEADITTAIDEAAEQLKQLAVEKHLVRLICEPIYPARDKILNGILGMPITERISAEIDRLAERLEELRRQLSNKLEEQEGYINSRWLSNKTSVVPGDMLLDKVLIKYGLRYNKERDSARIAGLMRENEIDMEIKSIVREVGQQ